MVGGGKAASCGAVGGLVVVGCDNGAGISFFSGTAPTGSVGRISITEGRGGCGVGVVASADSRAAVTLEPESVESAENASELAGGTGLRGKPACASLISN